MALIRVESIIREINERVDSEKLARLLNYHPEKIQIASNSIKCFCPLHKEQAFRSLLIEQKTKSYRCTMKKCVGFDGGSLVDLWAIFKGIEPLDAALELAEKLKLDIDVSSLKSLGSEMMKKAATALEEDELAEARQAIDQALAFLARDPEAIRLSANIYLAAGDTERANEESLRLVDIQLEAGDHGKAKELLAPLVAAAPNSLEVAQRQLAVAEATGDTKARAESLFHLARVHAVRKDSEKELATLENLTSLFPEDAAILEVVAAIYEKTKRKTQLADLFGRLSGLYEVEGQWPELYRILERREALDKEDMALQEQMARTLLLLGDMDKAAERFLRLADFHKELNDDEKAQELLRQLLGSRVNYVPAQERLAAWSAESGKNSESVELYRKLANQARESGDIERSTRYLAMAKKIDPDDCGLRRDLAEGQLSQNNMDEGIKELFELANVHLNDSDPSEGLAILGRIAELAPDDVPRQIEIGRCLEAAGHDDRALQVYLKFIGHLHSSQRFQEALPLFEEAQRISPRDNTLLELRVEAHLALGQKAEAIEACRNMAKAFATLSEYDQAEQLLARAIKIDRTESSAKTDLARLFETVGRKDEAVQLWIEVALFHRAAEDGEKSLQAAREALRLDPANSEAKGLVAESLENQGQIGDALELWKESAESLLGKNPSSPEALAILDRCLKLAPKDTALLAKTATLRLRTAGAEAALPMFREWLEKTEKQGTSLEALDAYQKAVESYPKELAWRARLAQLLMEQGDTEEAIPHLEKLIGDYRALNTRGPAYRQALERLVKLRPESLDLKIEWAETLAEDGDFDHATGMFADIARQYLARGDQESGLNVLRTSLKYQPDNRDLLSRVAELLERSGKTDEAIETYERLVTLNRQIDTASNVTVLQKLLALCPERSDLRLELARTFEANRDLDNAAEQYYRIAQAKSKESPAGEETLQLCLKLTGMVPEFMAGREALVDCYLARKQSDKAKVELDAMGDLALRDGDLTQAEEIFRRIQQIDPSDIGSGERLGKLYEAKGQNEDAAKAYRTVLALFKERGDKSRIIAVLQKLKGLAPSELETRFELARALSATKGQEDAAAEEWFELVSVAIGQKKAAEARKAHDEAAKKFEGQWDRRFRLTQLYSEIEEEKDNLARWRALSEKALAAHQDRIACDAASEALCLAPDSAEIREFRVEASRRLQDWEAAETDLRLLAEMKTNEGQHPAAESYLARAIEMNPDNDELTGMLAQSQIAQHHVEEAVGTLRHLAELCCKRHDLTAAIKRAEEIVALRPADTEAKDYLASILLDALRLEEAMDLWREVAESLAASGKTDLAILRFEGILVHLDRDVDALRRAADLTRESRGDVESLPRYERLLDVMIEDNQPAEVEAEFKRILAHRPENLTIAEKYALYLQNFGKVEVSSKEFLRIIALWRDERKNPVEAIRLLELLRTFDPGNLDALAEEAALHESIGDNAKAAKVLRELAELHRSHGDKDQSATVVARCAKILSNDIEAQVEAAEAYEALSQIDKATAFYVRAIEIYDKRTETAPCIPLLKRVMSFNPSRLDLGEALAQAYEKTNQLPEAAEQWLESGASYETFGKADRAAEIYRHIKKVAPHQMECRRRLARIAESAGDAAVQLHELREMIAIAPEKESPEETISILRRIRSLDPKDVKSLTALADQYRSLGRKNELSDALAELEHHYAEANELDHALAALDELKNLRPDDIELTRRSFDLMLRAGQHAKAARTGIEIVRTYLENSELDAAESMMTRIAGIEPENLDRRVSLAQLAAKIGFDQIATRQISEGFDEFVNRKLHELALRLCEAGLELFNDDLSLRGKLIKAFELLGRTEEAIQARISLAELQESQGQDQDALETLQAILADHPDHEATNESVVRLAMKLGDTACVGEYLLRLAEIHYVAGRLQDSIGALERMLQLVPEQTELRGRLGELYHEAGDAQKAREVWLLAANEFRTAGSVERASEVLEKILSLHPEDTSTLALLTECYRESGDEKLYLKHGMDLAQLYAKSGAFGDAISALELLADKFPKDVEIWEELAVCYREAGEDIGAVRCYKCLYELHQNARKLDRAKIVLESAIQLCETDTEMLQRLGEICLRLNQKPEGLKHLTTAATRLAETSRNEEARKIVDKILKIDPANLETRRLFGHVCEKSGDIAEAVRQYSVAARGWLEKRNHALAIEIFEHLLLLDPTHADEREAYARALEREGRSAEACEQYLKLIDMLPADADPRQTIRYCRQILKEDPAHVRAHVHLCTVYERTAKPRLAVKECQWIVEHHMAAGEKDHAEEFIRRGLDQCPDEIELRKSLIDLLIESGRQREAAENLNELATLAQGRADQATARWALERACEVNPSNIEYRLRLAEQQDRAGESAEGRRTRIEVMRLHLEAGDMEEARRLSEKITESAPEDEALRRKIADIFEGAGLPEVAAYHLTVIAKAALTSGRHDRVREVCDQILRIKPRHVPARECLLEALTAMNESGLACDQARQLYELYLEGKDYESAQRVLKSVIQYKPSDAEPREMMIELYRRMGRPEAVVEQLRRLAEIHANAGDVEKAIRTLNDLIRERPDDTRARSRYIDLYSQVGDEDELYEHYIVLAGMLRKNGAVVEATKVFERLLERHPDKPECREMFIDFLFEQSQLHRGVLEAKALTDLYIKLDRKAEAGRILDRAVAKAPDDLELRQQLAALQLKTNRRGLALETLRELLRQYETSNNELKQIEVLEQMLVIDESNVENRQRLAGLQVRQGQSGKAREQRLHLAEDYLKRELYDLAEREYRRILDLFPAEAELWQRVIETHLQIGSANEVVPDMIALSNLYVKAGRLKDAVTTFKQILDVEPDNVEILQKYIEVYLQIGLEQDLVDDYLHLATLYSRTGEVQMALTVYQHLREVVPENQQVQERIRETGMMLNQDDRRHKPSRGPDEHIAEFLEAPESVKESSEEQNARAIRNYENILKLNPENPMVRSKLAELFAQTGKQAEADQHWTTAAVDFFNRGDLERSIEIYTDLMKRHPDDAKLRTQLSRAAVKRDSLNVIEGVLDDPEPAKKRKKR